MLKKLLLLTITLVLIGCSSQPDVSKLKADMPEAEVISLLGEPDQAGKEDSLLKMKASTWTRYDPQVVVMFQDGKAKMAVHGKTPLFGADAKSK